MEGVKGTMKREIGRGGRLRNKSERGEQRETWDKEGGEVETIRSSKKKKKLLNCSLSQIPFPK